MKKTKLILIIAVLFLSTLYSFSAFASSFKSKQLNIPRGPYFIQSAIDYGKNWYGCWNIPGNPSRFKKGQNIQVWGVTKQDSKRRDRIFYIKKNPDNTFGIRNGLYPSNNRVDVSGGKNKNGTNILLWQKHNRNNQKFKFRYMGHGKWKIYTLTGKILCLDARSSKNGSNVHIWADHDGPWCEWVLINKYTLKPFIPKPKLNISLRQACLDIKSNRSYRYFSTISYSQLRKESRTNSIHDILDSMRKNKAITTIQNLVKNVSRNKNVLVRQYVYQELEKVNLRRLKKDFMERLLLVAVKKTITNYAKKETYPNAKLHLKTFANSL